MTGPWGFHIDERLLIYGSEKIALTPAFSRAPVTNAIRGAGQETRSVDVSRTAGGVASAVSRTFSVGAKVSETTRKNV